MKTKSHASRLSAFSFSAFSFFFLASAAFAADTTTSSWNGTTSTDWATAGNWITVVPSTTVSAKFNGTFTSGRQPTLTAAANTQGLWLATGDTQDVLINSAAAYALTISGNATLNSMANAGIYMNDLANHNLTIGSNTSITLSNSTGFYNQQTAGNLAISGGLNLNAKVLTIGANATSTGNVTISGNISGTTGAIVINSGGIVTLSGTNTYTGNTTLTLGTLKNGSANTFTGKGGLIVTAGTFDLNGSNASFTQIGTNNSGANGGGTITDNSSGSGTTTLTFGVGGTANLNTIGTLIKDGANGQKVAVVAASNGSSTIPIFALTSANTFSGGLTLTMNGTTGGNLRINSLISTAGSAGAITSSPFGTGAITLGVSNTDKINILMDTVANNTLANALVFNTATGLNAAYPGFRIETLGNTLSGNITAALADATFSAYSTPGTATLTGQVGGTYGLSIASRDATHNLTITLNNAGTANNYAGNTTIAQYATLTLGSADQIPNGTGTGSVTNNGTLALGGFNETINGLSGNGTVDGTSGTPILTVGDNNATSTFSGNIINTAGSLAITKIGTGNLTLSGTNTYTGTTAVNAGALKLDFSQTGAPVTNIISNSSVLTLGGGTLNLVGKASTTNSQTFASTTLNPGASAIRVTSATGNATLLALLGTITRNVGATVDFTQPTGTISATNGFTTSNPSGFLGGWATVAGTDWAVNNGTNIVALASYTNDTWAASNNTTVTTSSAPTSGSTTNSLRFNNAGAYTVTLSGNNTITSGGILVTSTVGNNLSTITGGNLTGASSADLVVIQNNTSNGLTIASAIVNNSGATGLTKSGTGNLTLSGTNTYSGVTHINSGMLQFAKTASLYNDNVASWTSGNMSVASGATLAMNVGGSGEFATGDVTTILTNLGGLGGAVNSNGLQAGSILAFDTTNASGANFTVGNIITDSTGTGGGSIGLTKLGICTLTLTGANTYTGNTTITAGTLAIGGTGTLGSGGTYAGAISNTGTFIYNSSSAQTLSGNLSGGGASYIQNGSGNLTISGNISGSGSITQNATGTLTLSGTNTHTGNTALTAGTLKLASQNALQSSTLIMGGGATGALVFDSSVAGKAFSIGGLSATAAGTGYDISLLNNAGSPAAIALTVGGNNATTTYAGNLTGTGGSLTKNGTGTLTLSGTNTYTGNTTLTAGTLSVGTSANLGNSASNLVFNGGTLQITGTTLTSISGIGPTVSFTAAKAVGLDINNAANTFTVDQVLNQTTGGLTKSGAGTASLNQTNTYTGTTTVNAGTLRLDFSTASPATNIISASSALTLGGGTLNLLGKASTTNSQTFASTTLNPGASAISLSANASSNPLLLALGTITRNVGATVDFTQPAGTISATNGFTTSNAGFLGGWATVGGTDWAVNNGTNIVALGSYTNDTWGASNNTTVTGDSAPASGNTTNSLRFNNAGAATVTLAGTNTITSGGILVTSNVANNLSTITGGNLTGAASTDLVVIQNNTGNGLTIASAIVDNTGATGLTKSGTGNLTLTGSNTYTGNTTINTGNLTIGGAGWLGNSTAGTYAGTIANNGSFTYNSTANQALNGIISGSGTIVQNGTGNLTLSGANTYAGGTTLNAGSTLIMANNSALGTGALTINGGTLSSNATRTITNAMNWNGDFTFGTNNFNQSVGAVTLGGNRTVTLTTTAIFAVNGNITDSGNGYGVTYVSASGNASSNEVQLAGTNTYSGNTTIKDNILLEINSSAAIGTGTLIMQSALGGGVNLSKTFGPTGVGTGGVNLTNKIVFDSTSKNGNITSYSSFASNSLTGGITITGSGNQTLSLVNSQLAGNFTVSGGITAGAGYMGSIWLRGNANTGDTGFLNGAVNTPGAFLRMQANTGVGSNWTLNTAGSNYLYTEFDSTAGNINLAVNDALATNGYVTWTTNATTAALNLAGYDQTVAGLSSNATTLGVITNNSSAGNNLNAKSTLTLSGFSANRSFSGNITDGTNGAVALVMNNSNATYTTQTIAGTNTYTGNTTLTAGTLSVGTSANLGGSASNLVFNGGTLQITGTTLTNFSTIGHTVSFTAGQLVGLDINSSANTFTVDQVLNQTTGGFTKLGAGTVILNQTNTYTGNTTISAGNLTIGGAGSLGSGSYAGAIANTGNFIYNSSASAQSLTGNISGTGTLTQNGTGTTLTLSGTNTYTGATAVSAGILKAGVASVANTSGAFGNNSAITMANTAGATLDITGFNTQIGSLTGGGAAGGNVTLGNATLTVGGDNSSPAAYAGGISGAGGALSKIGTGNLTLSGTNTYTGNTTVKAGTLSINTVAASGSAQALGQGTAVNLGAAGTSSGTLLYTGGTGTFGQNINALGNGADTIQNTGGSLLTLNGTITKNGTVLTLKGGSGGINVTQAIVGTASSSDLVISGGNTTLSAANTYNGPTSVIGGGNLTLGINNAIPSNSALTLGNATTTGTLNMGAYTNSIGSLAFGSAGGTLAMAANQTSTAQLNATGNLTLGSNNTINLTGMSNTLGLYKLVVGSGLTGTFNTVTGLEPAYKLVYTSTELDAQHKAAQTFAFTSPASTLRALVNTTVSLNGTLTNSAPSGSAALAAALTSTGNLSVTSLNSSTGSTVVVGTPSTITGNISTGASTGTFAWQVTNTDANAVTSPATIGGSINAVNQRSFSVGTPTIALGRFLINTTPTGTTAITSSGLNAVTANATLGSFSGNGTNGLTLTTSNATAFNGASSSQTANYTIGGSISTAGALSSASFSSPVTAELGSISNVSVNVTGSALNQRSFSVGTGTIALGRFLINTTPTGTTAITSSGLNAVTANATLGSFSGNGTNGLTLTTSDATAFNGASSSQTANYTIGGSITSAGALSGASFSSPVTAELGSISNVTVNVTGSAVASRTVNNPSSTSLGNYHVGDAVSVTSNAFGYSYGTGGNGTHATTEDTTVQTYGGSADANGITLGGLSNFINTASTFTRTFTGTAAFASTSGSFNLTVNPELSSATSVTANYTIGVYNLAAAATTQTANVGAYHVGLGKTIVLTLNNTAPTNATYTETLQTNGFSGITTNFTATGSASGIIGGGSGNGTLSVGVGTSLGAGAHSGNATLALQSNQVNTSGLGTTNIGNQTITITGTGYNLATANAIISPVALGTIHVGDTFTSSALSIQNTAASGNYTEGLDATKGAVTGNASVSGSNISNLAGNATSTTISVGLDASTAGAKTGTVLIALTSNGTVSGLANTALANQTITLNGDVFNGTGVWTQTTGTSGSWATAANWTDANGIHAAPGTFSGFDSVDTATFNGTGTTATINLDGTTPSLKALNFSGGTTYTIAKGTGGSLQFKSDTGNATLTAGSTGHTISADVILASNLSANVTTSGNTLTVSGNISESGGAKSLTKTGAGTLTLTGNNTYSGNTTIAAGTLSVNNVATGSTGQALGTGTVLDLGVVSTSSGTLLYTGGSSTFGKSINALGNGGDTIQNTGSGTLTLNGTITNTGTTLTLKGTHGITVSGTGTITGSGGNLIIDGGTTTLGSSNTYNGSTSIVNGATLNANVANALPTSNGRSAVLMDQTGTGSSTLALGADQSIASLTGNASSTVNLGSNQLTVGASSGSTTYAGSIHGVGGSLKKDDASTFLLAGTNDYSGPTYVSSGTLIIASTGSITSSANVTGGTLTVNYGGTAGAISLNGGYANINGSAGTVAVNSGGTLTGSGSAGAVTVASGGILAPGNAGSTAFTVSSLALESGSTTKMVISNATTYDRIAINGALALVGNLTLDINSYLDSYTTTATLFSGFTSLTGNFDSVTSNGTYTVYNGTWSQVAGHPNLWTWNTGPSGIGTNPLDPQLLTFNTVTGQLTVVPEPQTWVLVGIGITFMLYRRRFGRMSSARPPRDDEE